jgi:hypothetical protein
MFWKSSVLLALSRRRLSRKHLVDNALKQPGMAVGEMAPSFNAGSPIPTRKGKSIIPRWRLVRRFT